MPDPYPPGLTAAMYWEQMALKLCVVAPNVYHDLARVNMPNYVLRGIGVHIAGHIGNDYRHQPSTIVSSITKAIRRIEREQKALHTARVRELR